jgi:hypothetical protein
MDGFRWTLKGGASCINLYFPGWTLNTHGKLIAAMVGVLVLAMMTEAISKLRHKLSVKARNVATGQSERKKLVVVQTLLHGVHAFVGYIVMLAVMTFSLELGICVISGLTLGYLTFGGESYSHVSTNPCCAFLEEEANERELVQTTPDGAQESEHAIGDGCEIKGDVENTATEANGSEGSTEIGLQ